MKNQHSGHNKIIPIKSLVENSKQNSKRNYLQLANKDIHNVSGETINTPKSTNNQYQNNQLLLGRPETPGHKHHPISGDKMKGISVANSHVNQVHFGNQKPSSIQKGIEKGYSPFEQVHYSSLADRFMRQEHGTPGISIQYNPQNKKQSSAHVTPQKSRGDDSEEKNSFKMALGEKREAFKSMTLKRGSAQFAKDSSFLSGKFEDETWNASRFQNVLPSSQRETQSIFKNDLTKIKTELFQKEAQLFELSQRLEQKDGKIKDLISRLEHSKEINRNLKEQLSRQGDKKSVELTTQIERLSEQVMSLTQELNSKKMKFERQEENASTNNKLLMLKIKQFELQDNEKTQYIIDLKEKEKRNLENYQKINNGLKELLRQKQNQLNKISQAAQFYKDEVSKSIISIDSLNKNASAKEEVIRQLSGQVIDLKSSLNQMQVRIRQMIESEDDLKNQIEFSKDNAEVNEKILSLEKSIEIKAKQNIKLSEQNDNLINKIKELELKSELVCIKSERQNNEVKDFELSMMEKTCDQYKRKIDEYHKYSEQMRVQISELKRILIQRDQQIVRYKLKYGDSIQKQKKSPYKSLSPIRDGAVDEKQLYKLKNLNLKLFKDNEKMNTMIKDQNNKIHQFYKVNKGLNETIVSNEVERLNYHFSRRWRED